VQIGTEGNERGRGETGTNLGGELLAGGLPSGGLAGGLLRTGHLSPLRGDFLPLRLSPRRIWGQVTRRRPSGERRIVGGRWGEGRIYIGRREGGAGAWAAGDAWTEAVSCDRWGSRFGMRDGIGRWWLGSRKHRVRGRFLGGADWWRGRGARISDVAVGMGQGWQRQAWCARVGRGLGLGGTESLPDFELPLC
jgi:hypothetical protein